VVGVVITLIATGSFARRASSISATPVATPVSTRTVTLSDAQLATRLRLLVAHELGPSPEKAQPRLIKLSISPVPPPDPLQPEAVTTLRTVLIRFRLNNHPLGGSWRLKAAKGDVFLVLRGLYTSGLPVGSVEMTGVFPLKGSNPKKALQIYLESDTASRIPWHKMGRSEVNEARVWKLLDYKWVDPRFG
jgi:hypothetical protein